ncbi:MAG TPA: hypothetical protein VGH38_20250 [Bryobacteraceae bacterium]
MRKLLTSGLVVFAGMVSLPAVSPKLAHSIPTPDYRKDPRFATLRKFFLKFDCPAWEYTHVFLEAADDYKLDWRLLPSLSYVESSGGKSARNNNIFGWNSGRAQFSSPAAGIHTVGYRLAHSRPYRNKGLDEVLFTYNPNPEYAAIVKSVMRRIAPTE